MAFQEQNSQRLVKEPMDNISPESIKSLFNRGSIMEKCVIITITIDRYS